MFLIDSGSFLQRKKVISGLPSAMMYAAVEGRHVGKDFTPDLVSRVVLGVGTCNWFDGQIAHKSQVMH